MGRRWRCGFYQEDDHVAWSPESLAAYWLRDGYWRVRSETYGKDFDLQYIADGRFRVMDDQSTRDEEAGRIPGPYHYDYKLGPPDLTAATPYSPKPELAG